MRKIFLSTVILNPVNLNNPVTHKSRDLDLGDKHFIFPISYLLDTNLSKGDNALILTGMSQTEIPKKNYELLKEETEKILKEKEVFAEFAIIDEPDADIHRDLQDSLTFSEFMKKVSDMIQDGDEIYADITYGMKSYTLAMFIAVNYATKALSNVSLKRMIYSQFYKGNETLPATADIIDITSLFQVNKIIEGAKPGKKEEMDRLLTFMIG